jgi:hypothetical protein
MATKANGKYQKAVDISSVDFDEDFDYLFIEGNGNLTTKDTAGNSVTITVPSNFHHLCGGKQVTKATTTATGITAYKYSQDFNRS